jgi:hypothetical protein
MCNRPGRNGGADPDGLTPKDRAAPSTARLERGSVPVKSARPTIPRPVPVRIPTERAALATLDKLNRGVLLVTAGGEIEFMNRSAAAMLSRGGGLTAHAGRLEFKDRELQADTTRS